MRKSFIVSMPKYCYTFEQGFYLEFKNMSCCIRLLEEVFRMAVRLGSNYQSLLAQHDITVDHTVLSGVVKLFNLRFSTVYDNVQ